MYIIVIIIPVQVYCVFIFVKSNMHHAVYQTFVGSVLWFENAERKFTSNETITFTLS